MKIITVLIVLNTIICQSCSSQSRKNIKEVTKTNSLVYKNNEILKDYFLCKCIEHGFEKDSISTKDHSTNVLVEMSDYYPDAFWQIDSIAKDYAYDIPVSNYTGKKGVLFECANYYKSNKLDSIVRSLDSLIYK